MTVLERIRRLFEPLSPAATNAGVDRVIDCTMEIPSDPPRVYPTLQAVLDVARGSKFIPAALIAQKAKSVSDGIFAGVEGLSTNGDAEHVGVLPWLQQLETVLLSEGSAAERIRAALQIGRTGTSALGVAEQILRDPLRSKPIGFYTWDASLARVFVRDRFLQAPLPELEARAIASVLAAHPNLGKGYAQHLRRISRFTDRLSDVTSSLAERVATGSRDGTAQEALFPPSHAVESKYGGVGPFFDAVRKGQCDLTPTPESGFYAFQRFALTALFMPDRMPEATARTINAEYADALERLAGVAFFFARETHVKQLEPVVALSVPIRKHTTFIFPELTIEPVPSFYRLTADAFRFLHCVIAEGWGDKALETRQRRVSGPIARTLQEGIEEVVTLCDAAAELSNRELEGAAPGAAIERLRERLASLRSDEDVVGDARGMIPLGEVDPQTGKLAILAFAGWEIHPLEARITKMKCVPKGVDFGVEQHLVPVPVVRELVVDSSVLLDRDEFRAACDQWLDFRAQRRTC